MNQEIELPHETRVLTAPESEGTTDGIYSVGLLDRSPQWSPEFGSCIYSERRNSVSELIVCDQVKSYHVSLWRLRSALL